MDGSLQIEGEHKHRITDAQLLRRLVISLGSIFLDVGQLLFLVIHLVTKGRAFLFHLAHRSLSLSVFVEIADGFVGELLGILQYLVGFLVCLAQNLVLALIYALVFLLKLFLELFNLGLVAVDFKLLLFDSLSL